MIFKKVCGTATEVRSISMCVYCLRSLPCLFIFGLQPVQHENVTALGPNLELPKARHLEVVFLLVVMGFITADGVPKGSAAVILAPVVLWEIPGVLCWRPQWS